MNYKWRRRDRQEREGTCLEAKAWSSPSGMKADLGKAKRRAVVQVIEPQKRESHSFKG